MSESTDFANLLAAFTPADLAHLTPEEREELDTLLQLTPRQRGQLETMGITCIPLEVRQRLLDALDAVGAWDRHDAAIPLDELPLDAELRQRVAAALKTGTWE